MSATTGTSIAFPPPACAWGGGWYDWANPPGGVIGNPPAAPTNPAPPMAFSPLPTDIPAQAGIYGGDSGAKAACIVGATGSAADITAGMGLYFGITPRPDGGHGPFVQVNASSYTGISFWTLGGAPMPGCRAWSSTLPTRMKRRGLAYATPPIPGRRHAAEREKSSQLVRAGSSSKLRSRCSRAIHTTGKGTK